MRIRRASRLILLDDRDRVPLFEVEDATVFRPEEPSLTRYWVTSGGSLEAGERHEEAVRRELWEETGIAGLDPGPWVALREPVLGWAGEMPRARDRVSLARVAAAVVDLGHLSVQERTVDRAHRWWPVADPRSSGARVVPPGLPELLGRVVAGDVPGCPLRLD
jgi:8-oxo-dGTP pyrophosphatase MutT (NUDIX family)